MKFSSVLILIPLILLSTACEALESDPYSEENMRVLADETNSLAYLTERSGLLLQWASGATASSSYSDTDWAPYQAIGKPDTPQCGDFGTSWGSSEGDGIDWLELSYDIPVTPSEVIIFQTNAPNQVVSVELIDLEGGYHPVYNSAPYKEDCPYRNSIVVSLDFQVVGVRISVDQSQLGESWDEIDAVALIGTQEQVPVVEEVVVSEEPIAESNTCNTDISAFFDPELLTVGEFFYRVSGDAKDMETSGNTLKVQSTVEERVIGLVSSDVTAAVTLFLPYDLLSLIGCVVDLPLYDPAAYQKAPNLALYAQSDLYYPTSGQLYLLDMGDGTVSGAFWFYAEQVEDASRVVVVEGAFNALSLP